MKEKDYEGGFKEKEKSYLGKHGDYFNNSGDRTEETYGFKAMSKLTDWVDKHIDTDLKLKTVPKDFGLSTLELFGLIASGTESATEESIKYLKDKFE